MFMHPSLYLSESDIHGLGVFCHCQLIPSEDIEESPLLPVKDIKAAGLEQYHFDGPYIGVGYLMMYNHSDTPNAKWTQYEDRILITTIDWIRPHEEITINYMEAIKHDS